eukprot:CAMPEP_0174275282 /NCGR_PEP_ID=MMETSP0439-20130205/59739_1 /TAXON_ID=0 /ORGANISM="Stereomyxa ramosa, Strain Chinc5" /LENGTH=445 /DNA_ID=CAMNT_0015367371 /DNA_START=1635 /DNA_END=2972 /DNA_ORIENTATION=-
MVESIKRLDKPHLKLEIQNAKYNTFLLPSESVFIDLLTDSGTSAMSDTQWAGMMKGDEAYAGSVNFTHLEESINQVLGYKYVVPTHQGRGAEHLVAKALIKKGDIVPRNMYFTTSKAHVELVGGEMVDVAIDEAHDTTDLHPFKGNVDIDKLQKYLDNSKNRPIPFVSMECNVNMAGGQPFSIENIRKVAKVLKEYEIPIILDATRSSENAFFIHEREAGYQDHSIPDILKEITSYSSACTYSAKKDCLVNIGGFIATNDKALFNKCRSLVVIYEGLHTYGGMAGRDMEAMAIGLREGADKEYLKARISQVRYLGKKLKDKGIPIVEPIGSHGIFIDALKFLPHIPREHFPAQSLTAAIYEDGGVRGMERGAVSKGRDKDGNNVFPKLELVRLAVPRRVYTQSHMDYVANSIARTWERRAEVKGLEMTYEPGDLRFFQAEFKPVS